MKFFIVFMALVCISTTSFGEVRLDSAARQKAFERAQIEEIKQRNALAKKSFEARTATYKANVKAAVKGEGPLANKALFKKTSKGNFGSYMPVIWLSLGLLISLVLFAKLLKGRNAKPKIRGASFTLIELMIVIAILGLLAILYPSDWDSSNTDSRIKKCAMEMEAVLMAMKMYSLRTGSYPKNAGNGKDVPELAFEPFMPEGFSFTDETPVGGSWKYHEAGGKYGVLQIFKPDLTDDEIKRLDTILDDGVLNKGALTISGNKIEYVVHGSQGGGNK